MKPNLLDQVAKFFKKSGSNALGEHRILLICLGLSLLVWFFVKMTHTYESRGVLSLNYYPPMGQVFAEPPLRSMPFKFSGTGWRLLTLGILQGQLGINFNLSSSPVQIITRTEISRKIEEQLQLNLLELGQDAVTIRLDSLFSKRVMIHLDTLITYKNGYYFKDSITLLPDSITVFGAKQMLDPIDQVSTEKLKMPCPETDFKTSLSLLNPNPELLQFSSTRTDVFLPVEQFTEKTLTVPIMVLNAKDSIKLVPAVVTLSCVVGVSHYRDVSPSDFRVVAVFGGESGPTSTASMVPLTLVRHPAWVRSTRFTPRVVEYLIVK